MDIIKLQDELTGALIGLARATDGNEELISSSTDLTILEGLTATIRNSGFGNKELADMLKRVDDEKRKLIPLCYECTSCCGKNNSYNIENLKNASAEVRSLKLRILLRIRGMAAYMCQAAVLGCTDSKINHFFYKALFSLGMDEWGADELLPIIREAEELQPECTDFVDKAVQSGLL